MKTQYLLNTLKDSIKEKHLLFVEGQPLPGDSTPATGQPEAIQPPGDVTPDAPAGPDAPQPAAPEAAKTLEQVKKDIETKMGTLKTQLDTIVNATEGTYTKKLVETAKAFQAKLAEIDETLKTVDPTKLEALKKFDEELTKITPEYNDEKLKNNAEGAALIKTKREKLAQIKAEVTEAKVFEIVLKELGADDTTPAPIKEALKAKFNPAKYQTETIDISIKETEALLDAADNETDPEKVKAKIDEFAKEENLKPEDFDNDEFVKAHKPILAEVARLQVLGGDGKACKAAKEAMAKAVGEDMKGLGEMTPEIIKQEYEQGILIAHVCDVLNSKKAEGTPEITPESIQKALLYYELGKHESGKEKAEAKKILDLLVANKDLLVKAGIKMDLMGGTDGTDHQLLKAKAYHEAKAAALKKLLAFSDGGKLNVVAGSVDLAAGSATRKLIEEYIKETAAGKGYEFVKANQDAFTKAGKIFDAALAVQRAEDMKKRLSGNKDDAFGVEEGKDANGGVTYKLKEGESGLAIELGTTNDKEEERKSGLNFSAIEKEAEDDDDEDKDEDDDEDDDEDEDDNETFEGKYSTPEFRAEIKKEVIDAKNEDIEAKTQEVYDDKTLKFGEKSLDEARKDPEFKKEVIKRLTGPTPAPAADPDADPAADPNAPAPGGEKTPEQTADDAATADLNKKIGEAKIAIEDKIKAVDAAIDEHEGALTQGPAKDKIGNVKTDLNNTFAQVNGLLKTAGEKAAAGNIDEAQKDYDQAAKILQDKLEEAQQKDSNESFLNQKTREAIVGLRQEVESRKPAVKTAFDRKKETLSKLKK